MNVYANPAIEPCACGGMTANGDHIDPRGGRVPGCGRPVPPPSPATNPYWDGNSLVFMRGPKGDIPPHPDEGPWPSKLRLRQPTPEEEQQLKAALEQIHPWRLS